MLMGQCTLQTATISIGMEQAGGDSKPQVQRREGAIGLPMKKERNELHGLRPNAG